MSSMSPSVLFLKRNLRCNDDSTLLSYHRRMQNNWLDMMRLVPPTVNWTQNNSMTHYSNNVSMTYVANPRVTICKLNAKKFKLKKLMITIENGFIVINGNKDEKRDKYGLTSRKFTRRVAIPRDVFENEIKVQLFSNGLLSITAKKRSEISEISIQLINLPALTRSINQPAFRQPINRQRPVMFNHGYSTFLENFRKSPQPFKHNRFINQKLSMPMQYRKKTVLNRNFKKHWITS